MQIDYSLCQGCNLCILYKLNERVLPVIMLTVKMTQLVYVAVLFTVWMLALVNVAVDLEDLKRNLMKTAVDKTGKEQGGSCATM